MSKLTKEQELIKAVQEALRFCVAQPRANGDKIYEELVRLAKKG